MEFLKDRKKYSLETLIVTNVLIGILIIFTKEFFIAPLDYSIF